MRVQFQMSYLLRVVREREQRNLSRCAAALECIWDMEIGRNMNQKRTKVMTRHKFELPLNALFGDQEGLGE